MANSNMVIIAVILVCYSFKGSGIEYKTETWINHGGDIKNRRFAEDECEISVKTAPSLKLRWAVVTGGEISATPAIYRRVVYVPSWNGVVSAVSVATGSVVWSRNLSAVTGFPGAVSRSTPMVTEDQVIFGLLEPVRVISFHRRTGRVEWISPALDNAPLARITMSGTAYNRAFYVGTSSLEETDESKCCTFQGSIQKLDLKTGARIWKTLMIPDNHGRRGGYSGTAVWGSSPAVDGKRGLVYIATGNLYTVPQDVQECLDNNRTNCIPENLCDDAVVAVDMKTGSIRWCKRLGGNDVFVGACRRDNPPPNCPAQPGPDYDFGEAPMLVTIPNGCGKLDVTVTAQKSGIVYAHDRTTGQLIWETVAGPGGSTGGAIWGSATDNERVYTNIANSNRRQFTLVPTRNVTTGGGWVAVQAASGRVVWSTANPTGELAPGPVTIANQVLFVASYDPRGHVYALDANNGRILWGGVINSRVYGGFSVKDGCAYVGSGLPDSRVMEPNITANSLFAYCVN